MGFVQSNQYIHIKAFLEEIVPTYKIRPKKYNLVFRATVLKTLGRVGSILFLFFEN